MNISAKPFVGGVALLLLAVLMEFVLLVGCSADQTSAPSSAASATSTETTSSTESTPVETDTASMDFEYSKRDTDASFDEATAAHITLSGASATVAGSGATAEGSTVTVTAAGTYVVSGSLDDGQIVVAAGEEDKVQLVLSGATIHNEDGPAICVNTADKVFVTLAENTENVLSDGSVYALAEGEDEPNATLYSKADLALNGTGSLAITSAYRHAVCSKDDLIITDGTYTLDAAEDALRGRDCVKICGGDFDIQAVGDGIKSNNDEDATRGFVSIDGGTFAIRAGDDGVQAVTYLRVMDGVVGVESTDDALHSAGEGLVAGGTLTIQAGDDAVHAETSLTIQDGAVDVTSCYEGFEAEKIYLNGGTTHIVASDDAVNAAAAASADTATVETMSGGVETEQPGGAGGMSGGGFEGTNERQQNGGAPDNAFAEGMGGGAGGGMTMGDENCLVQVNGGYTVLESVGDALDSNGSVEITGGVLLVNGPTSGGDGAFDYDLTATVSGGTVLMVGSTGMAQNFTSGTQPFAFTTSANGSAGQSVALVDSNGAVIVSMTAAKQFGMVLASDANLTEGGTYQLVIGGTVSGANADGYAADATVSGGSSTNLTASTTASGGMGGLGAGGNPMDAGQGGDVQNAMRGGGGRM